MITWAIVQLIVRDNFKMRVSVDSELYISSANNLLNGDFPKGSEVLYASYIFLLALLSLLNLEPASVVYIHFIAAVIAIFATYQLSYRLTRNIAAATFASLLYILWFKFHQWNLIVYTDALFSHMVIISIYALVKARSVNEKGVVCFLILFTSLLRPTGIGLLLATSVYAIIELIKHRKLNRNQQVIALFVFVSLFIWILNAALKNFIDSFIESYSIAEIIYPKLRLFVDEPTLLYIPNEDHQPIIRLFLFVIRNPIYFAKISTIKGLLFVGHIKPYYSLMHNVFIASFLYPVYLLSMKGYLSMKKESLKVLMIVFLGFQFFTVCLTSENWDGRFLLPILPLIFIFSSLGFSSYFKGKAHFN